MSRLPATERREQLLDSAADVFATSGYARATTAQLARAAGVTEPIIYRHFRSKRDLFIALIERTGEHTLAEWKRDLSGLDDPSERLVRLLGDNPMVSERGRAAYRVFLQAISESGDPEITRAVETHIHKLHRFVVSELSRAQRAGRVPERFSPEILAWVLIHTGMGYGVLSAMDVSGHGVDAGGVHVQQVLGTALLGRRPKAEREHKDEKRGSSKDEAS